MSLKNRNHNNLTLSDIVEKLKSFNFSNKMAICESTSLTEYNKYKNKQFDKVIVYPHEMEVFAVLSILSYPENGDKIFNQCNLQDLFNIFNCIKNFIPTSYSLDKKKNIRFYISNLFINQFNIQQDFLINLYRYNYFFNFKNERINMPKLFKQKFNINYNQIQFISIFLCIASIEISKKIDENIIKSLENFYPKSMKVFTINRLDYIKKQMDLFHNNIENCHMGFKLIFQYPFISFENKLHYPIPYAIKDACTSSLLYRLTESDNVLRATIGKEVLESYLFFIHKNINLYDEIEKAFPYFIGKNKQESPDLMIKKNNKTIIMDIKSSVPSTSLREFNANKKVETVSEMVNNIIQIYKNIMKYNNGDFGFKSGFISSLENTFGIVIILEDNYLDRKEIADLACEKLKLIEYDEKYNFIHSNIRILNLSEVEMLALDSTNLIDLLEFVRDTPDKWYDMTYRGMEFDWARNTSNDYKRFKSRTLRMSIKLAKKVNKHLQ